MTISARDLPVAQKVLKFIEINPTIIRYRHWITIKRYFIFLPQNLIRTLISLAHFWEKAIKWIHRRYNSLFPVVRMQSHWHLPHTFSYTNQFFKNEPKVKICQGHLNNKVNGLSPPMTPKMHYLFFCFVKSNFQKKFISWHVCESILVHGFSQTTDIT